MNDPGAEPAIDKADEDLQHLQLDGSDPSAPDPVKKDEEAREKQQHDYRDPSLWWFASTGCPLIAGTFGPLANAFSICALVRGWRVYIPPGAVEATGIRIEDPAWLLAVNAISLFFAVVANGALLLNMSRRLRFKIAQPISVIGFFLAGILLVADIVAMVASPTYHLPLSDPAAPAEAHALSSAFYYAIQAAVIYLIVTGLMCLTAWGAWRGHFEASFRLSVAQRTLMLQTMSFVAYLLLGALVFSSVEGWEYLDALYWADITLLTIGLGSDFHPSTHAGRSLLFFFAIGGIIIIGLVIGSIRTLVLDRGKRKLSARMMEKKRLKAIKSINPKKHLIRTGRFSTMHFDNDELNAARRRELEFNVMRAVQENADRDRKWMALAISTTAALTLWFLGALVFTKAEKPQEWSYFEGLYFTYVVLLTIGYGDLYPESNSGKAFFVLWTLLAIPTLTILISDMSDTVVAAFSNLTVWVGSITVLPGDRGTRVVIKEALQQLSVGPSSKADNMENTSRIKDTPPGLLGETANAGQNTDQSEDMSTLVDGITSRLASHLEEEELSEALSEDAAGHTLERDIHFYHVVLAREIRTLMHSLNSDPPKRYSWREWEYFLKLMDNLDPDKDDDSDHLVPKALRSSSTIAQFKDAGKRQNWTWLGMDSPLLSYKSETEWVLERLGTTLERELIRMRKKVAKGGGEQHLRAPPVSLSEMLKEDGGLKRRTRRKEEKGEGKEKGDV